MPNDFPLECIVLICPSTIKHHYILRYLLLEMKATI